LIKNKDVDECAWILIKAWEEAEGKPVNVSYYATFADMARALLKAGYKKVAISELEYPDAQRSS
jgi:hypothetical protein